MSAIILMNLKLVTRFPQYMCLELFLNSQWLNIVIVGILKLIIFFIILWYKNKVPVQSYFKLSCNKLINFQIVNLLYIQDNWITLKFCLEQELSFFVADSVVYFSQGELSTCWYILLSGSVFIEGSMFLPRSR